MSLVAGGGSTSIANPNVSSNNTSSSSNQHNIIHQYNTPVTAIQPQQSIASSPAFLSLLPRSLSALSLGGRKNKADKDLITASFNNTMEMSHCPTSPVSSAGVDLVNFIHFHFFISIITICNHLRLPAYLNIREMVEGGRVEFIPSLIASFSCIPCIAAVPWISKFHTQFSPSTTAVTSSPFTVTPAP